MASLVQDVWLGWEPRGQGGSVGRFGSEVLDDARRLVREGAFRWGTQAVGTAAREGVE